MTAITKNLPLCTHRYALFVSYLGTKYNGSQRLTNREDDTTQDTVQEALEWSLEKFLPKNRCRITSSSRTDRGVHAFINCFTLPLMDFKLSTDKFKSNANDVLLNKRHDIVVKEVLLVPAEFHPRLSVEGREYIYRIAVLNGSRLPSVNIKRFSDGLNHHLPITELYKILPVPCFDYQRALEAIEVLKGRHNFASFAAHSKENVDTTRELQISLTEEKPDQFCWSDSSPYLTYQFHFKAKSFLHNMVRRLVGCILSYASLKTIDIQDIRHALDNPGPDQWKSEMFIAEPFGLYLSKIHWNKSAFEGTIKTSGDKIERVDNLFEKKESDDCASGR